MVPKSRSMAGLGKDLLVRRKVAWGIMRGVTVTKDSESEGSLGCTEFQGGLHNLMRPGFTRTKARPGGTSFNQVLARPEEAELCDRRPASTIQ